MTLLSEFTETQAEGVARTRLRRAVSFSGSGTLLKRKDNEIPAFTATERILMKRSVEPIDKMSPGDITTAHIDYAGIHEVVDALVFDKLKLWAKWWEYSVLRRWVFPRSSFLLSS